MEPSLTVFEHRRHAHRVLRNRKGADLFNPFRHIPWDCKRPEDLEAGAKRHEEVHHIWRWSFRWPTPEVPFTLSNQVKRTILTSWINVLLLFVPVGFALHAVSAASAETFAVNYIAEIPLWFMCDYALEEIEKYIGPTASDLIDIFTTNTVQVISSFLLLLKSQQVSLLQTSLVGGILSNILVLLGLSILIGGVSNYKQKFNRLGAQGASSLLSVAATSLLIPTSVQLLGQTTHENLVRQSRGVAVVLLFVYSAYTFCQMVTHRQDYYKTPAGPPPSSPSAPVTDGSRNDTGPAANPSTQDRPLALQSSESAPTVIKDHGLPAGPESHPAPLWASRANRPDSHEIRGPQLSLPVATLVFVISIVLLYFCIDATVDSISALTEQTALTPMFVGLVLLPIPNCDFAPISLAVDNFLEQTMRYTVGRSVQTALLVEPVIVLLGWWTGVGDVTLAFDGFEVVSLFTTILLLNFLLVDGECHWVHGILLLADWVLIGIAAYFVSPESLK